MLPADAAAKFTPYPGPWFGIKEVHSWTFRRFGNWEAALWEERGRPHRHKPNDLDSKLATGHSMTMARINRMLLLHFSHVSQVQSFKSKLVE